MFLSSFQIYEGGYIQSTQNNREIAASGSIGYFSNCFLEMAQEPANRKCHMPERGYYWDSGTKTVVSCGSSIAGCEACSTGARCNSCPGFYNVFGVNSCSFNLVTQCKEPNYNLYKVDRCDSCSQASPNHCRCRQYQFSKAIQGNSDLSYCRCLDYCKTRIN